MEAACAREESEIVSLTDALGRITAERIVEKKNLPSFNNSAMDGFAITSLIEGFGFAPSYVGAIPDDAQAS